MSAEDVHENEIIYKYDQFVYVNANIFIPYKTFLKDASISEDHPYYINPQKLDRMK